MEDFWESGEKPPGNVKLCFDYLPSLCNLTRKLLEHTDLLLENITFSELLNLLPFGFSLIQQDKS